MMLRYLQRKSGEEPDSVKDALALWRRMSPKAMDRTYKAYENLRTFFYRVNNEKDKQDWNKPTGSATQHDRRVTRWKGQQ